MEPKTVSSEETLRNIAAALRVEGFHSLANEISDVALYSNAFDCNKVIALIRSKL